MEMLQLTQLWSNLRVPQRSFHYSSNGSLLCTSLLRKQCIEFWIEFNQQFWTFWSKSTRSSSINLGLLKKLKMCKWNIRPKSTSSGADESLQKMKLFICFHDRMNSDHQSSDPWSFLGLYVKGIVEHLFAKIHRPAPLKKRFRARLFNTHKKQIIKMKPNCQMRQNNLDMMC